MGLHSFLYCDVPGKEMPCNIVQTSYLLIPKEFGGGHIKEYCYKGYSQMGTYDVFELLAEWNKRDMSSLLEQMYLDRPRRYDYENTIEGECEYEEAFNTFDECYSILQDFVNRSKQYMKKRYGEDYLREIGIYLHNFNTCLKYPLKIAYYENSVYEEIDTYSGDAPLQGCR